MSRAGRHAALAGAALGLAAAPHLPAPSAAGVSPFLLLALAAAALVAARPAARTGGHPRWAWVVLAGFVAGGLGVAIGDARVAAIDRAAFVGDPGERVSVRGFVAAVPRPQQGNVLVPVATSDGLLAVVAPAPDRELQVGRQVRASGVVRDPEPWQSARLRVAGIGRIVDSRAIESTARRRGGLAGLLDGARDRAETALERGVPPAESALARGFVLGQDDRIDAGTVDDFRRSGLAHLLAVSGQNVLLLALLAFPVLAVLGVSLRARFAVVIALIAIYVPITGAGPSIQRAAVMGVAGIVAVLAGRPAHRWYAILLAAAVTLALNPRAAADVGWQLSFAAVVGILLWSRPIAALAGSNREGASRLRRGFAEGIGVTVAATIATAPVSALHFETVSLASLPANLLALPAVAPVMWLGMLSAALGQLPWVPVEPLNWVSSLLVAYIAQVADWLAAPEWASVSIRAPSASLLVAIGLALVLGGAIGSRALRRRTELSPRRRGLATIAGPSAIVAIALLAPLPGSPSASATPASGLTVTALDVGQGDAILLDPDPGDPVLVDAGPPGAGIAEALAEHGVERLAAAIITHDESDHSGGLPEVLRSIPVATVVHNGDARHVAALARSLGADLARVERGDRLQAGALRMEVLWPPPREGGGSPGDDPNQRSLVLHARWHRFDALFTGDAEAEAVPIDPGPVELLKVAHHGSEDAGLTAQLDRTDPGVAVISVGAGNPYGHPHPATLAALDEAGAEVRRTDLEGDVTIAVDR